MPVQDYTITILVDKSPEEVFKAINKVRGWWDGQIDGDTDKLGAVFAILSSERFTALYLR